MMKNLKTPPYYTSLASALVTLFGNSVAIAQTDRLSGGDINKAYGLTLNTGDHIFMKANAKQNASIFTAEAEGLSAISATKTIGAPEVLCTGTDNGEDAGYSFLLEKYVESSEPVGDYWKILGRELAEMHKADTQNFSEKKFGFIHDNFIGLSEQKNSPKDSWVQFFRENRLLPQFKKAEKYFEESDAALITKLLDHLEEFLVEPEKPSLLHGDLWYGNVLCSSKGKAILIDSASYVGHAEADLSMTELFGGFPKEFYAAYREVFPMQDGYKSRRDLYNLYHLLNHLNTFGSDYLSPVKSIIAEYVGN